MKIAISQPRYLPSCNYIERMIKSDLFIVLDTVQHQKRAFEHRNRIKFPQGAKWLSIPIIRSSSHMLISEMCIDQSRNWQEVHKKSFELNYRRALYFEEIMPLLVDFYEQRKYATLRDVVEVMYTIIFKYLEIAPKIVWASDLKEFSSGADDLLLELVREFRGTSYISGPNGRNYIDKKKFQDFGIKLLFHDYEHPEYLQQWGDFIPYMTIWDCMLNHGRDTVGIISKGILNEE